MNYTKPYKTFSEQVIIWVNRGLEIGDLEDAEKKFARLNYYRLSAYALPFQSEKDIFNAGTKWEDVINLYEFDRNLRLKIIDYLEIVEVALKTTICHHFAYKYGAFGYVESKNFSKYFDHGKWFDTILYEKNRSKEIFLKHFKGKYKKSADIPVWMLAEIMSFGALSKMYNGMKFKDKKIIAEKHKIQAPVLINWLHFLTYIRNLCAHHARVWNRELAIRPKYPYSSSHFSEIRNDKIICLFYIVDYLFKNLGVDRDVLEEMKNISDKYPGVKLEHMGF